MSLLIPKQYKDTSVHPQPVSVEASATATPTLRAPSAKDQRLKTQWKVIADKTGVQATKERLKSYWTTVGIFSALTMTMTYAAVTNPTVTTRHTVNSGSGSDVLETNEPLVIAYIILSATSLVVSIGVLTMSLVLLAEVDLVCTDEDLDGFIDKFQHVFLWLTAVFGFTCFTLMSSIAVSCFYFYSQGTAIAVSCVCVVVTVTVGAIAAMLATYTRSKLKHHVDSANATVKAVLEKLRKVSLGQQLQQQQQQRFSGTGEAAVTAASAAAAPAPNNVFQRATAAAAAPGAVTVVGGFQPRQEPSL